MGAPIQRAATEGRPYKMVECTGHKLRAAQCLPKFALVTFPTGFHLGHELHESLIFSDGIEKWIAGEKRVAAKTFGHRYVQPLQGVGTLPVQSIDPRVVVRVVMVSLVCSNFFHQLHSVSLPQRTPSPDSDCRRVSGPLHESHKHSGAIERQRRGPPARTGAGVLYPE